MRNLRTRTAVAPKGRFHSRRPAAAARPARFGRLAFERLEPRLVLQAGSLIISELMAINASTYQDGDGEFSDWIEIHNPTSSPVELDGWYLTDDADNLTKWPFPDEDPDQPEHLLGPGDYLVVFASDGRDTVPGPKDPFVDPAGNLHTSFQLDGDGEYLALVDPDGDPVYEYTPEFPDQRADFSYGVTQDVRTLVAKGDEAKYLVPTEPVSGWTAHDFDDSGWVEAVDKGGSPLLITEVDYGQTDWFEIQNVSELPLDTSGWLVAVNDASAGNIESVHGQTWHLPASIDAAEVLYRTEDSGDVDNYFGSPISWEGDEGWVMIVDQDGSVADFAVWGYSEAQIAGATVTLGGFDPIALADHWTGEALATSTAGWRGKDVGTPGQLGSYDYNAGTFTVHGGGEDIWYGADHFYYVHQVLSGDGEISARVMGVEYTDPWAKAGVMIRESLNANSTHAMTALTPGNGVAFQRRTVTGGGSYNTNQWGLTAPYWVRVVRSGSTLSGYRAPDNNGSPGAWIQMGAVSIAMGQTVYIGLAVTAHNDAMLCTAEFDHVTVVGNLVVTSGFERVGDSDSNDAGDFSVPAETSQGSQNPDLTVPFPGLGQIPVRIGIGFNMDPTAFEVTMYKAAAGLYVSHLSIAEQVISDPANQAWTASETAEVINYFNTGGDGRYGINSPFPGTTIGSDVNDFVIEATATVVIPQAGQWTFGVSSDDGFSLELDNGTDTFFISYPEPRGPADTLGVFNVTQPGPCDLRLVFYERGGGSEAEVFAAQGSHAAWNQTDFRLVGDKDGGLLVTGFGDAIRTDVQEEMYGKNASLYVRVPFLLDEPPDFDGMTLRMMYNDGFVAYLNGVKIAEGNAPASPSFNSTAPQERPLEESSVFEEINVTGHIGALRTGTNVLAVHGLNVSADDENFLVLPELIASSTREVHRYFKTPTPGDPNRDSFIGFVADTTFSVDRGFYDTEQTVEITTATPGATIVYTTDGTEPTLSHGTQVAAPDPASPPVATINLSATTTLRAAAFKTDYYPANVDTQTYVFLDDVLDNQNKGEVPPGWPSASVNGQRFEYGLDSAIVDSPVWGPQMKDAFTAIPTMSLVTDLANLVDPASGIYVNAGQHGRDWERAASLELIYPENLQGAGFPDLIEVPDGQGGTHWVLPDDMADGFQVECGVRIRGGYSRSGNNPKHAFRLFFRREYGDANLDYPLFGYEGVDSFDKMDLRTAQNYSWSYENNGTNTMCRDVWARDTQGLMGQAYTRSRYYHLYINGQYWGIFQTQERPEAAFGASYFGGEREEWDCVKATGPNAGYTIEATDGTLDAWRDLWDLANAVAAAGTEQQRTALYMQAQGLNPDGTRNPDYPVLLDVDNLADYMLMVFFDGDRDAPISNFLGNTRTNNWYGIRNRNGEEGFRFFVHDAEHIMSKGLSDRTGPLPCGDQFQYSNPQWIHQQLVSHPEYRLRFADRAHRVLLNEGLLTPDAAVERFLARAQQIDMAIIAESARWGNASLTKNTWLSAVNYEVNSFFPNRAQTILGQLLGKGWYPGVEAPSFNKHGGQVPQGFELTMSAPSGTIYYTLDGTDPRVPLTGEVSDNAKVFHGTSATTTLVAQGATWKYLDDGSNQGTAWYGTEYDDGSWVQEDDLGNNGAQYGYGDGDEATVVSYGPSSTNKYITTYFRQTFNVTEASEFDELKLWVLRDDGAVVYLNGQEVARSNMPTGAIGYQTPAASTVGDPEEDAFYFYALDPAVLEDGPNVIAVEVHQISGSSSDMSFDLKLDAVTTTTSTPISLTTSALVKSRVLDGGQWSALNEAQFYVNEPATAENLVATEINYHPHDPTDEELDTQPPGADPFTYEDFQFVELENISHGTVDLTGVAFTDGVDFEFIGSAVTELGPGDYVVVVKNLDAFEARYETGINVAGEFTKLLNEDGEHLEVLDRFGQPILDFSYNDAGAWPGRADGKGATLELIDPAAVPHDDPMAREDYLEDGDNWRSSGEYGGSPGAEGEGLRGDVLVNEVLTNTPDPLLDSIELYNTTGQEITIGGWYLSDSWGWDWNPNNGNYKKYRTPDDTKIPAYGYLVFDEDDFNPTRGASPTDFALNGSRGDDVWLMEADVDGKLTRFVDHVDFMAAKERESLGRWPNGEGDLYPMTDATLGDENSGPRVGPVVVSELHYNPGEMESADDLEYLEIYNSTDQAVDMTDWQIRRGIDFDFPAGTTLGPQSALVVLPFDPHDDANAIKWSVFCEQYGLDVDEKDGFVGGYGYDKALSDDGERVQLLHPDVPIGEFIPHYLEDEVNYDDANGWPPDADGQGDSLNRLEPGLWGNQGENWIDDDPSPGVVAFLPNQPPNAVNDTAETTEGASVVIDVLANDDDPDLDPLTIVSIDTNGTQGQVTDNGDGTVTYDPNGQFEHLGVGQSDADLFSYTISDGHGGTDTAMVTVTITGENDPPVAVNDTASTNEDAPVVIAVLGNDNDVDNDPLSIVHIDTNGTLGQVIDNGNGTLTYDPNGQFEHLAVGQLDGDSFSYTISDGHGGNDTAQVTVSIVGRNDPPDAVDDTDSTTEDDSVVIPVLDNDHDTDSDPLTIVSIDTNSTKGEVIDNGDGTLTYDPNGQFEHLGQGESETDAFEYTVGDGHGGTDTAMVTVTITGLPDVRIVSRYVFYNNSSFDGNDPTANTQDNLAIATDKQPLEADGTAGFVNYTSYYRGINGIMVDIADPQVAPAAGHFSFRAGNTENPADWLPAPDPSSLTVTPEGGDEDSYRVTVIWDDYAIRNRWLQVTVQGQALGLAEDKVFYFGNAVGESGNSAYDAIVDETDVLLARNHPRSFFNPAPVTFAYDYNRDAKVNATDTLIARSNATTAETALVLLDLSGPEGAGGPWLDKATLGGTDLPGQPTDAALQQAVEPESAGPHVSLAKLTWLFDLEPANTPSRSPLKANTAAAAVDKLLDSFGL